MLPQTYIKLCYVMESLQSYGCSSAPVCEGSMGADKRKKICIETAEIKLLRSVKGRKRLGRFRSVDIREALDASTVHRRIQENK